MRRGVLGKVRSVYDSDVEDVAVDVEEVLAGGKHDKTLIDAVLYGSAQTHKR